LRRYLRFLSGHSHNLVDFCNLLINGTIEGLLIVLQALRATSIVVAGLGAISVIFYLWVFRALRGRPPVASLVAAIGVAFFARSTLTLFVGHDQQTFNMPLVRAWNFGGIRPLPTDLYVAAIATALLFALLQLTPTNWCCPRC
jgi:branched-subunit amino acid ABC-type transport system permease component